MVKLLICKYELLEILNKSCYIIGKLSFQLFIDLVKAQIKKSIAFSENLKSALRNKMYILKEKWKKMKGGRERKNLKFKLKEEFYVFEIDL
jgi:hypothetical protein